MSVGQKIAILAGGGTLPVMLAQSIVRQGGRPHIVALRGEAEPRIETFPHTWVSWGAVNAILAALKRESDGTMMIAGGVSRPDLMRLKPDLGIIRHLPKVLSMLRGGDDAVLTRLVRFFEVQGLTVKGVADVAPELIATAGRLGAEVPQDATADGDVARGFAVLDALSDLDVGQAVVIERGEVLAIEGVEGTDRMLARVAGLPGRIQGSGALVKGPKRGQDLRVDMPAVGAQTIGRIEEARLSNLVVAAGQTLFLDRDEMQRRATAARIAIDARPLKAPLVTPAVRTSSLPPATPGTLLGRSAPALLDARDARTAAEVTCRMAPFKSGRAAVVVREHVLAIAAAEGLVPMARRVATLRQWGRGRFARAKGAAAARFDPALDNPADLAAAIEILASGGIAGIAVLTPHGAHVIPSDAVAMADRVGAFILALDEPSSLSHDVEAA